VDPAEGQDGFLFLARQRRPAGWQYWCAMRLGIGFDYARLLDEADVTGGPDADCRRGAGVNG
jgi:hypothetical protein